VVGDNRIDVDTLRSTDFRNAESLEDDDGTRAPLRTSASSNQPGFQAAEKRIRYGFFIGRAKAGRIPDGRIDKKIGLRHVRGPLVGRGRDCASPKIRNSRMIRRRRRIGKKQSPADHQSDY